MGRLGGGCGRGERRRWRWWRSAMAAASEGESQERGGRTEGVEASPGAGTGRRLSLQREAGGGACVRGAFSRRQQQLWGEGRKTTGGERLVGWAAQELGRLGYQVSAR